LHFADGKNGNRMRAFNERFPFPAVTAVAAPAVDPWNWRLGVAGSASVHGDHETLMLCYIAEKVATWTASTGLTAMPSGQRNEDCVLAILSG
jgi:hypothetical protein